LERRQMKRGMDEQDHADRGELRDSRWRDK
jgi:hypothetical protein